MAYRRDDIERVRDATDLVDLVSEVTKVKKSGRSVMAVCPFHQEKTPSFNVVPAKGIYHCFGCNAGGDVFSFLMKLEGVSFFEAVLELGIAAAGALSLDVEVEDAIRRQAKNDPVHGVRVRAQALLGQIPANATRQNSDDLLHAPYDTSSLDAALLSARDGNAGESNRSRILSAVLANVRIEETIPALGKIGGLFEADMLSTIDDERQELAQKAIAEINHRLGSEN